MAPAVSPPNNLSLFFRRRNEPGLLPDKMMCSRNRTPAVCRICGLRIPGNYGTCPNRGEQRENLLPSRCIRSDEPRLFDFGDLHDDPYTREMRPVRVQASSDVAHVRPGRNPHGVKLLRDDPRLIWFVAHYIIQIMHCSPSDSKRSEE